MRLRWGRWLLFVRIIAAAGIGTYLGAAAAGLLAVLTGQAFSAGSDWLLGVPVLAVLGAAVAPVVGWLTRFWLAPGLQHRLLLFTCVGAVTMPLAFAISELRWLDSVGLLFLFTGWLTMLVVYVRALPGIERARARHRYARRVAQ